MISKDSSLSNLRAFSCIAIIILHVMTGAVSIYGREGEASYVASWCLVYSLFFAVPSFVMVTGALLLDNAREISIYKIWRKYISRIFMALLLCGLVFSVFTSIMDNGYVYPGDVVEGIKDVLTGDSWAHLWYLYLLIGLYIMLPFFRMIIKSAGRNEMIYLFAVYIVFLSLAPAARFNGFDTGFYIHTATVYPLYFMLGGYVYSGGIRIKREIAVLLAVAGTLGTVVMSLLYHGYGVAFAESFLSYDSVFVIIQTLGIFALFTGGEKRESARAVSSLDECSFGIYLFHMIGARYILRYMGVDPYSYGAWCFGVMIAVILVMTWLVVCLLKRVPGVKRVL